MPNSIERYAIGDRTPSLVRDADGGLTLTLQHAPPLDAAARANWLPAPEGLYFLCLRAYLPRPALLDGSYQVPEPTPLPELDWAAGYPLALALMVASVAAPFIFFRRKGWLR